MHFEFIFVYGVKKCSNLKNVDNSQIILKKKKWNGLAVFQGFE